MVTESLRAAERVHDQELALDAAAPWLAITAVQDDYARMLPFIDQHNTIATLPRADARDCAADMNYVLG